MFVVFLPGGERMGQATRTTKLPLDLCQRTHGGANTDKRAFYVDFFLVHAEKLSERVSYYSQKHLEMRERAISANELLTWAEFHTVETKEHPHPWPTWNFSECFPDMPFVYRRSVIKDAIGKVRAGLTSPIAAPGSRRASREGSQDCLERAITLACIRGPSS
jgi:hypothetical protein